MTGIRVILASASASRARLLANAGLPVEIVPSRVDEEEVKRALRADGATAQETAEALAELKALRVSAQAGDALVIGADQTLALDDVMLDKPSCAEEARDHLRRMQGRRHRLISAVCVASNNARIWSATDHADLTVRRLSDAFIDDYLGRAGDAVLDSVGAYQLEGLGAQLFSKIRGDYFTILGLPLLPLLAFMRERGVMLD